MIHRTATAAAAVLTLMIVQATVNAQDIAKTRAAVTNIGVSNKITVIYLNGNENYGAVSNVGTDTFEIVEIDQKRKLIIRYDEVKKVRANYGGKGVAGKRPNPIWGVVAGAALIGGIIAIVIASGGGS